jgi:hypothetical protein
LEHKVSEQRQSPLRTFSYWALLFLTLLVADDVTFGWIFWGIAVLIHPVVSALAALVIYWALGYWITLHGLSPEPARAAKWFLDRFQLQRKNPELQQREEQLKSKLVSVGVAIPMSLLFGGVLTTLWLYRRSVVDYAQAKRLGFWLCGLYAVEFALIHGFGIGGSLSIALEYLL